MGSPSNPLGPEVWRQATALGLRLAAIFFGVTFLVWLLIGALGWSGILRALCAMGVGPLVALAVIVGWWLVKRPALLPAQLERASDQREDPPEG